MNFSCRRFTKDGGVKGGSSVLHPPFIWKKTDEEAAAAVQQTSIIT